MPSVLVLGGGVNGLTCALELLKQGHSVQIWQTARGMAPPNWVWLYPPYHSEGQTELATWARDTLEVFTALASVPESHVHIIPVLVLSKDKLSRNPGEDFLMNFKEGQAALDEARRLLWSEKPTKRKYLDAQYYHAPVCDSVKYLAWLQKQIRDLGGSFVKRTVATIEEALGEVNADVVVNCTGLGSREILPDPVTYSCRGQLLHVDAPWIEAAVFDNYDDDDGYVIPCPGCELELGGTSEKHIYDRKLDPSVAERILRNAISRIPSLETAPVGDGWVGLRPNRDGGVRVELEWRSCSGVNEKKAVIHNYGHGGAGMMLSYGCAKQVVTLVDDAMAQMKLASRL